MSVWKDSDVVWQPPDPDLEENPLPAMDPIYFSDNAPVSARPSTLEHEMLLPRAYRPLISTPSPTASRCSTPSSARLPEQTPSVLLPAPQPRPYIPQAHLRTVSLETAKAAHDAPGSEHLLPEEMRARTAARARSSEPHPDPPALPPSFSTTLEPTLPGSFPPDSPTMRLPSLMMMGSDSLDSLDQTVYSRMPRLGNIDSPASDLSHSPSNGQFHTGSASGSINVSRRSPSAAHSPGPNPFDEPERGRTRYRAPRCVKARKLPPLAIMQPFELLVKDQDEHEMGMQLGAIGMAAEYASLLESPLDLPHVHDTQMSLASEQRNRTYPRPSISLSPARTDVSESSAGANMRLAPQPLFQTKPMADAPGSMARARHSSTTSYSISPGCAYKDRFSTTSRDTEPSSLDSIPSPSFFPAESDLERKYGGRLSSASGEIPISPPFADERDELSDSPTPMPVVTRDEGHRSNSSDKRVSAYYPYIGKRRGVKPTNQSTKQCPEKHGYQLKIESQAAAALGSEPAFANLVPRPAHSVASTPPISPSRRSKSRSSPRKRPDSGNARSRSPGIVSRVVHQAGKVAEMLAHPAGFLPTPPTPASPESPHVQPAPPIPRTFTPIRLGWSDESKSDYDASQPRSYRPRWAAATPKLPSTPLYAPQPELAPQPILRPQPQSRTQSISMQTYTHVLGPARPLDGRAAGLAAAAAAAADDDQADAGSRPATPHRGSIFGSLLDLRREKGKERKREEIKRTIRMVPNEEDENEDDGDETTGAAAGGGGQGGVGGDIVGGGGGGSCRPSSRPRSSLTGRRNGSWVRGKGSIGGGDGVEAVGAKLQMSIWGRKMSEYGMI